MRGTGRLVKLSIFAVAAALAGPVSARQAVYPVPPKGTVRIGFYYALDPTCAVVGMPKVFTVAGPSNGTIETREVRDYPNYPTFNVRARCDTQKVPVTEVLYRAAAGFHGIDTVVYAVAFPRGQLRRFRHRILVP